MLAIALTSPHAACLSGRSGGAYHQAARTRARPQSLAPHRARARRAGNARLLFIEADPAASTPGDARARFELHTGLLRAWRGAAGRSRGASSTGSARPAYAADRPNAMPGTALLRDRRSVAIPTSSSSIRHFLVGEPFSRARQRHPRMRTLMDQARAEQTAYPRRRQRPHRIRRIEQVLGATASLHRRIFTPTDGEIGRRRTGGSYASLCGKGGVRQGPNRVSPGVFVPSRRR